MGGNPCRNEQALRSKCGWRRGSGRTTLRDPDRPAQRSAPVDALGAFDPRPRRHAKHPPVASGCEGGEMLLFAVPILVRSRLARSAGTTRTPSDAPRRSRRSHLGARSDPVGGWLIWLSLMISAIWAATAGLADSGSGQWLLMGSIALAAGGLIGLFGQCRRGQYVAITRPTAAPPTRRGPGANRTRTLHRPH